MHDGISQCAISSSSLSWRSVSSWFLHQAIEQKALVFISGNYYRGLFFLSSCYPFGLLFMLLLLLFCFIVSFIVLLIMIPFFITLTLLIAILQSWKVPLLHRTHLILATHLHKCKKQKPSLSSRRNKGNRKHQRLASLDRIGLLCQSLPKQTAQSSRDKRKNHQTQYLGKSRQRTQKITKKTGWASKRNTSRTTKSCPSSRSWSQESCRWWFQTSRQDSCLG